MAVSCETEVELVSGQSTFTSDSTRNCIRYRLIDIPTWIGRRPVSEYQTQYFGLGYLLIGEYNTGDPQAFELIQLDSGIFTFQAPWKPTQCSYMGPPGAKIGVRFCTIT